MGSVSAADQHTYTKNIEAETKANLDGSVDCCVLQVLREAGCLWERGDRIPGQLIQSHAIQPNPNKCCAIACCYDNGGLSEKEGRRLPVFSAV